MHYVYLIFTSCEWSGIGIGALFGCFFKKDFTSSNVIAGSSSFAFLCVACVLPKPSSKS